MMRNMVVLSGSAPPRFHAAPAATPTIDQSLSMKSASDAQISPDGRYVAYVVQQANWDENEFTQQIWAASTGHRRALSAYQRQEVVERRRNGRPIRAGSRSRPTATASARST